ncbi:HNH endonuclease [Priestia megaterium]|uniref:HNH endonuclease n=1 Tax=Priestia megaterium TaxID=1404 RepID=UPI002040CED4|nr:HNH endonuclease [Priestia megaterium]MCM3195818.1 hypothetical protein [Priestia megaterium]
MVEKKYFANWLFNNSKLSSSTIEKYASAINTISTELRKYGLLEDSLFSITDPIIIEDMIGNYLSIPEFRDKDIRGNRMYSNALKYFKKFTEYLENYAQIQNELIIQKVEYEKSIIKNNANKNTALINIIDRVEEKPVYRTIHKQKIWRRNPIYASNTIAAANYLCEFNNNHKHFVSKFNNRNYVEAHHLIPIKYQEHFDYSLDVYANIVSVCPVCHKQLHYGLFKEKKPILDLLFLNRKERLLASGIGIEINELYRYYQR